MKETNVNSGHRERLRQRYLKDGNLDNFADHEIIELFLFQFIPYKDTNKIAHQLLDTFGGINEVLFATAAQLKQIKGISDVTAVNIAMHKDMWLRCRERETPKQDLSDITGMLSYAKDIFRESRNERLIATYTDFSTRYSGKKIYTGGSNSTVEVSLKTIVNDAITNRAAGLLLMHGHINGKAEPSEQDVLYTQKLYETLASVEIVLLDHIILNERGEFYSFRQNGKLAKLDTNNN